MNSRFVISLDFELFWGMQDCVSLEKYEENVLGGRKAIPRLLDLFEKYGIHCTWATVGFMFAESFDELKKYFPEDKLKPHYCESQHSTYRCFSSIGKNENDAPCFYAPSLIKKISKLPYQEIACHTFSHYYCNEKGQTINEFKADIASAVKLANDKGYKLKTIVLPRNQCNTLYLKELNKYGFIGYRDEENDWIHKKVKHGLMLRIFRLIDVYLPLTGYGGYNPKQEYSLVKMQGSRMYKPYFKYLSIFEGLKIHRIKKQMLHAAKKGLVFHLWWHPHNIGIRTDYHLERLKEILDYYLLLNRQYGMESINMQELAESVMKGD